MMMIDSPLLVTLPVHPAGAQNKIQRYAETPHSGPALREHTWLRDAGSAQIIGTHCTARTFGSTQWNCHQDSGGFNFLQQETLQHQVLIPSSGLSLSRQKQFLEQRFE